MIENAKQITVITTLRVDSPERKRNIDTMLRFLQPTGIHVKLLEADKENQYKEWTTFENVDFTFIHDENPIFYRTRYINQLLKKCTTPIVAVWDTDIILSYNQLEKAAEMLLTGKHIIVIPYNLSIMYLSAEQTSDCLKANSIIQHLQRNLRSYHSWMGRPSYGGIFMVNCKTYLQCGGENEHFYSWGPEDAERVHRVEILGYPVLACNEGPSFHLWHPIGQNSYFVSKELACNNKAEFVKVCNMEQDELRKYVKEWNL